MAEQNVAQLRRVPRRAFDSVVGILYHGKYSLEHSFQVGEGGIMVSCARPIAVGECIVLSFIINAGTIVMVRGVIRNEIPANAKIGAPNRYNVEFVDLEFQFKRAIRNYVAAATQAEGMNALGTIY